MFNTNKTLEQKVKTSMATLPHRVHRAFYYYTTVRTAYICVYIYIHSCTDAFTLSGFTTIFKAALNDRNSTGHRVAFIIMNAPTETEKWFAFILRSTGAAVRALAPRERVWCTSRSSRDCVYIYIYIYILHVVLYIFTYMHTYIHIHSTHAHYVNKKVYLGCD